MKKQHEKLLKDYFNDEFGTSPDLDSNRRIYLAATANDDGLNIDVALDYEEETLLFLDAFTNKIVATEQIDDLDLFFSELRFDYIIGIVSRHIEGI